MAPGDGWYEPGAHDVSAALAGMATKCPGVALQHSLDAMTGWKLPAEHGVAAVAASLATT